MWERRAVGKQTLSNVSSWHPVWDNALPASSFCAWLFGKPASPYGGHYRDKFQPCKYFKPAFGAGGSPWDTVEADSGRNSRIFKLVPPSALCIADGAAVYIGKDLRDMIQDIAPKVFDNQYKNVNADDEAYVIYAYGDKVLLKEENGEISVPKLRELSGRAFQSVYLFSIDGQLVFMPYIQNREMEKEMVEYWQKESEYQLYRLSGSGIYTPKWLYFACGTVIHLNRWYHNNRFCGFCGEKLIPGEKERILYCPCCGNTVYPKISPAVIVGVVH